MFPAKLKTCCFCMDLAKGVRALSIILTILEACTFFTCAMLIFMELPLPTAAYLFYVITAIITKFQTIFGILLILGAFRNNPGLMRPWALVAGLRSLVMLILVIIGAGCAVVVYMRGEVEVTISLIIKILCYLGYAIMTYYAAWVINSYRLHLSAGTHTPLNGVNQQVASAEEANLV